MMATPDPQPPLNHAPTESANAAFRSACSLGDFFGATTGGMLFGTCPPRPAFLFSRMRLSVGPQPEYPAARRTPTDGLRYSFRQAGLKLRKMPCDEWTVESSLPEASAIDQIKGLPPLTIFAHQAHVASWPLSGA